MSIVREGAPSDVAAGPRSPVPAAASAVAARPTARPSRARRIVRSTVPPLVLGVVLVGAWYFISYVMLDQAPRQNGFLLRPPHKVLQIGFFDWDNLSEILRALWSSTRVALIGLVIAIVLGFTLAILMSQAKLIERAFFPYLVTLQAIPILALVPMIQFWWGTGQRSRVAVCVIIAIFPIIVNTLFGLQSAERGMHDLFTLHHATRLTRLRKLMFPAALPAVFAGLRIAAGLSVIGAIVGDFFFGKGDKGIGQLLRKFANDLRGEELLASVIMSSLLGVSVFLFFGWLQQRVTGRWHEASGPGS